MIHRLGNDCSIHLSYGGAHNGREHTGSPAIDKNRKAMLRTRYGSQAQPFRVAVVAHRFGSQVYLDSAPDPTNQFYLIQMVP